MPHYEFTPLRPQRAQMRVDGVWFSATNGQGLIEVYVRHMADTGQRLMPGWQDRVMAAIQQQHPKYVRRIKLKGKAPISVATMMSFVRFFLKRIGKSDLESPQVAHARAAVCRTCPLHRKVAGCGICRSVLKSMVKPPEVIEDMQGCEACGCYMGLKVWIPAHYLRDDVDKFPYWEGCWMRHSLSSSSEPARDDAPPAS